MKKLYFLPCLLFYCTVTKAQNVGIGTTTPLTKLHVADSSVLFSAPSSIPVTVGNVPLSGGGRRLLWYADKAAFRVGRVTGPNWDTDSIGYYSFAEGYNSKAKGQYAFAGGFATDASGPFSVALGGNNFSTGFGSVGLGLNNTSGGEASIALGSGVNASGDFSLATGNFTTASGNWSTAMGYASTASGGSSAAIGYNATASGGHSLAIGNNVTASGNISTARGMDATASGDFSVAIGKSISTNGKTGSFFLADSDPFNRGTRIIGTPNQMAMRFNGGYYLLTSNAAADIGVQIPAGGNSWTVISDARRKENFMPVDGEAFLQKISTFNLTSWNYKTQDAKSFRHYGPMAQEFYAAFGKDDHGTIGNDTTINQADFDGVNLIAIQALEKRTTRIQKENEALTKKNQELEARLEHLEMLLRKSTGE